MNANGIMMKPVKISYFNPTFDLTYFSVYDDPKVK